MKMRIFLKMILSKIVFGCVFRYIDLSIKKKSEYISKKYILNNKS